MNSMREILFRGRRGNEKWRYGSLLVYPDGDCFICIDNGEETDVLIKSAADSDTVGQYTGLTDKNGVKIFEGDIVHIHDTLLQCTKPWHEFDGYVDFMDGSYRIVSGATTNYRWVDYGVEVIGNIYDNPELLKGGAHETDMAIAALRAQQVDGKDINVPTQLPLSGTKSRMGKETP